MAVAWRATRASKLTPWKDQPCTMSLPGLSEDENGLEEKFVSLVLVTDEEDDSSSTGGRSQGQSGDAGFPTSLSEDEQFHQICDEIQKKEALAKRMQHSRSRDFETSVELLEQVLMSKLQLYGPGAEEVFDTCEQLTLAYNTLAMKLIDRDDFDGAHELLKKAEVLTDKDSELSRTREQVTRLRAVTFNNLGCLFKHRRNFYTAIKYLERALHIEESTSYAENPASTHLNLCATLSMCGRHDKALAYANAALKILNKQMSLKVTSKLSDFKEAHKQHAKLLGTLSIAYHSAATQHEYLNEFEEASSCYKMAKVVAGVCWLSNSPLSSSLRQSHAEFREKVSRRRVLSRSAQRPQSAGPRLGRSPNPLPHAAPTRRPPRTRKPRPPGSAKGKRFANVPINTVRIYRGEAPVQSMQKDAKENACLDSAPKKGRPEFDTRPSSARLSRDSAPNSSGRGWCGDKSLPGYMQPRGCKGRTRPRSARV